MTFYFRNYSKLAVLSLLLLFLTHCQKEETVPDIEKEIIQNKSLKTITLDELRSKLGSDKKFNSLSHHFDINKKATLTNKADVNGSNAVILTDNIRMIEGDTYTHYTLGLLHEKQGQEFYNLILRVDNVTTEITSHITKYTPTSLWLNDISQPFQGYINVVSNDLFSTSDIIGAISSKSSTSKTTDTPIGLCLTSTYWYWECDAGNNHAPDAPLSICSERGSELKVHFTYGACPEEDTDNSLTEEGGGGGFINPIDGAPSEDPNPTDPTTNQPISTTPTVSLQSMLILNLGFTSLTQDMLDWINNTNNVFKVGEILNYLNENENSEEAKEFTKLAIEALREDEDLDFEKLEKIYFPMEKECQARKVFDLIINGDTSLTNFIKNEFLTSTQHHLQLEDIDLPGDIIANTSYPSQPILNDEEQNGIRLYFDNSYLDNASNLSIALTAAHEFIHVRFGYLYIKGHLLTVYPTYTDINNAFTNFYNNQNATTGEALDDAMHDVYDDFLDEITDSVFNYAINNNVTGANRDYCEKMVLGAHQGTNAFQNLTPEQQTEYSTIIVNENESKTNAKGSKCE